MEPNTLEESAESEEIQSDINVDSEQPEFEVEDPNSTVIPDKEEPRKKTPKSKPQPSKSPYWQRPLDSVDAVIKCFNDNGLTDNARHLSPLREALVAEDEDSLSPWVDTDLLDQVIQVPKLAESNHGGEIAVTDIMLRVFVFLPIVWTWWCLAKASQAYSELRAANADAGRESFVSLWQQGFGGYLDPLWSFESFSTKAVYLGLVIVFAVLLTGISSRIRSKAPSHSYQALQTTLVPLVTDLKIGLAPHRLETLPRYKSDLANASRTLSRLNATSTTLMQQVQDVGNKSYETYQIFVQSQLEATEKLHEASRSLVADQEKVILEFGDRLAQLGDRLTTAANTMSDLRAMITTLVNEGNKQPEYVSEVLRQLNDLNREFTVAADAFHARETQTVKNASELEESTLRTLDQLQRVLQSLSTMSLTPRERLTDKLIRILQRIAKKRVKRSR